MVTVSILYFNGYLRWLGFGLPYGYSLSLHGLLSTDNFLYVDYYRQWVGGCWTLLLVSSYMFCMCVLERGFTGFTWWGDWSLYGQTVLSVASIWRSRMGGWLEQSQCARWTGSVITPCSALDWLATGRTGSSHGWPTCGAVCSESLFHLDICDALPQLSGLFQSTTGVGSLGVKTLVLWDVSRTIVDVSGTVLGGTDIHVVLNHLQKRLKGFVITRLSSSSASTYIIRLFSSSRGHL